MGFFSSAIFFIFPKMLVIYLDLLKNETATKCRKTFKESYDHKKEWV